MVRYGKSYRIYQSVGYGYRSRTELTKLSGTGMDVVPSLPKCRVWYGCLYPHPYPTPCISTRLYPVPGYFAAGVPNLPKRRVRVWMSYRTYQRVGYEYGCLTKLTKGPCMVRLLVPVPIPDPGYFYRAVPGTGVFSHGRNELTKMSDMGCGSRTKLTKVSGAGNTRGTYP